MVKRTNPLLWRALRAEILLRQKMVCRVCGVSLDLEGMQLDHKIPLADGGKEFDIHNLQALCCYCHGLKTQKENKRRRDYVK